MFRNKHVEELNQYKQQLNQEYREVFDEIIVYLRVSYLPEKDTELLLQDILSNFLQSQAEGKTVEHVTSEDYKGFCDALIHEYTQDTSSRKRMIYDNIGIMFLALSILVFIDFLTDNILGNLLHGNPIVMNFVVRLDSLLFWCIAMLGTWYVLRIVKNQTFVPKVHVPWQERFLLGIIIASPFFMVIVSRQFKLDQIILFTINGFIFIGALILARYGCKRLANH